MIEFITSLFLYDPMVYFNTATAIVTGAAALSSITPTKTDDRFITKVGRAIDFIGFNFGYAKNRSLEEEVKEVTEAGQKRRRARIDAKKGK